MKTLVALVGLMFALSGCVTDGVQSPAAAVGYPINAKSKIELKTYFKFMPSLSGYYLPAGIYEAEAEDADGVFFRAPQGAKSLSLTGSTEVEGGIYLPKQGGRGVRGYAYLRLPLVGRSQYFMPDDFFSAYGKNWGIIEEPIQPAQTTPGS